MGAIRRGPGGDVIQDVLFSLGGVHRCRPFPWVELARARSPFSRRGRSSSASSVPFPRPRPLRPTMTKPAVKQLPARTLGAGRYVVLLREPGATQYDGGVAGLQPTKVSPGQSFNARSDKVADYQRYLTGKQNRLADRVGAEVADPDHAGEQRLHREAHREAGDGALRRPRRADAGQGRRLPGGHLEHPSLPRPRGRARQRHRRRVGSSRAAWPRPAPASSSGCSTPASGPSPRSFRGTKLDRNPNGPFDMYRQGNNIYMQKADGGIFRGFCQPGEKWAANDCNSKIVGARYYPDAFLDSLKPQERDPHEVISTRDGNGHGSHTASTAAGNFGVPASVEGQDFGTISGMAPAAKIAAYKVCFSDLDPDTGDCYTSSTLVRDRRRHRRRRRRHQLLDLRCDQHGRRRGGVRLPRRRGGRRLRGHLGRQQRPRRRPPWRTTARG